MNYYLIRHKESGEFMPEIRRRKGYTHWNPSSNSKVSNELTGCPRLISSRRKAHRIIVQWASMPNAKMEYSTNYFGEEDYDINFISDGRKKEDLEIVPISISEREEI